MFSLWDKKLKVTILGKNNRNKTKTENFKIIYCGNPNDNNFFNNIETT